MKKHLLIILLPMVQIASGQSNFPEPPPINPVYGFNRHLFVDCVDDIVNDINNGDVLSLESELENYISTNYISGIALDGIRSIIRNPAMEQGFVTLLDRLKNSNPRLYISVVIREDEFNNLSFLDLNDPGFENCVQNRDELRLGFSSCKQIDGLHVRFEKPSIALSIDEAKSIFRNYIEVLKAAQEFKCKNSCIRYIDAEFDAFEDFTLDGWTITDQLTDADPLIDRMIIRAFTNRVDLLYGNTCRVLHLLSDRFSKNATNILIGLSAESPRFRYCDKPGRANDYLGEYLTGRTSPSGNMTSAERDFLNKLNDRQFNCSWCNCSLYASNHFDAQNVTANRITGSMWYYYSMMKSARITKFEKEKSDEIVSESWSNLLGQNVEESYEGLKLRVIKYRDGRIQRILN